MSPPEKPDPEDYYLNEDGLMVMTAAHHLRRGYCCRSGCKHCPYGYRGDGAMAQARQGASPRVVCLVPSLTETLIEAGVNVVGRTRFCIHPEAKLGGIARVGGTKDARWEKIADLAPELIIVDREENPLSFLEPASSIAEVYTTRADGIAHLADDLERLSDRLDNEQLRNFAQRYRHVLEVANGASGTAQQHRLTDDDSSAAQHGQPEFPLHIPGLLSWITVPTAPIDQIIYLIWQDPFMAVGGGTFIFESLKVLGIHVQPFSEKYPKLALEKFDQRTTLLLCSSEPFPFHRQQQKIKETGMPAAVIDGEAHSWFGIRNLRFLEKTLQITYKGNPLEEHRGV